LQGICHRILPDVEARVRKELRTIARVLIGAVPVIAVLVAAAFVTPPDLPHLARQLLLFAWGVGGIVVSERLIFGTGWARLPRSLGFVRPRRHALVVALIVSVPMWGFLPIFALATGIPLAVSSAWPAILLGVVLVNGVTEEVIHRAFVFGRVRTGRSFAVAASISAAVFALQHLYLVFSIGPIAGGASVLLALCLGFPLAFLFERGGNSLAGPAIVHTSSNAPMMLFASPELTAAAILPHMGVVLAATYLSFAITR
jgi:membrane protease YdiL (CAAX protease family)